MRAQNEQGRMGSLDMGRQNLRTTMHLDMGRQNLRTTMHLDMGRQNLRTTMRQNLRPTMHNHALVVVPTWNIP